MGLMFWGIAVIIESPSQWGERTDSLAANFLLLGLYFFFVFSPLFLKKDECGFRKTQVTGLLWRETAPNDAE